MRTEIKIGIIVGLVVVAGGIIFFVNQGKKTAGNVTDVLPMDAPAGKAAPGTAKTEPPRKPGDSRQTTPARATGPEKPPASAQRPPVTTPLSRTPATPAGPTAQPPGARPLVTTPPTGTTPRQGEPIPEPTPGPAAARPTPTPAERESTTQPRSPAELPPLAGPTGPMAGVSPAPAGPSGESVLSGATGAAPGVSLPPRKEPEPATAMPPPAPERTLPAANAAKYTVAAGDSLWSIAEEHYGDGHLWTKLKAANPGIDENVKVGQVLSLPPKEELLGPAKGAKPAAKPEAAPGEAKPGAKPTTPPADAKPAAQTHTYVAESGDTLFKIAAKVLGNGHRWRELLELNKDKLAEPEDLKAGMELRVPANESAAEKAKSAPAKPEPKKNGTKKSAPSKSGASKKS